MLGSNDVDGAELVDAGVVDQDVELAVGLDGGVDDGVRVGELGDVTLDGYGCAAGFGDGVDCFIGAGFVGGEVDDDGGASGT